MWSGIKASRVFEGYNLVQKFLGGLRMRIFKTLIVAAFAVATSAGMLVAADDPLEIHGGGRVGWVTNSKLGSESPAIGENGLGTMPNYGESHYFGLSFSKKVTADGGAWAKVAYAIDNGCPELDGDVQSFSPRTRDVHVEFGGLDFMPAGAVLWGGLRGYGTGWNGQQDHSFINLAGVGFGIQNIGGIFSLAYMQQDVDGFYDGPNEKKAEDGTGLAKLGNRTVHNIIANISVPIVDIYGAFGYSKKADVAGEANMTEFYVAGIFHAPVYGINVGLSVANNSYAREVYKASYDTWLKVSDWTGSSAAGDKTKVDGSKATGVRALVWTVTDLAPGLYTATSIRYDMLKTVKKSVEGENTFNKFYVSSRWSKALTKNLAFVPVLGYGREWDKEEADKTKQVIQVTGAFEVGLDTGFWAGQKLQLYGTYTKIDSDHKFGGAYDGKTSAMDFGMLVTFGF